MSRLALLQASLRNAAPERATAPSTTQHLAPEPERRKRAAVGRTPGNGQDSGRTRAAREGLVSARSTHSLESHRNVATRGKRTTARNFSKGWGQRQCATRSAKVNVSLQFS